MKNNVLVDMVYKYKISIVRFLKILLFLSKTVPSTIDS